MTSTQMSTSSSSWLEFTSEIDAGRPAQVLLCAYADEPTNPTDQNYGWHWPAAVGYWAGSLFPGHSGTRWVIVHDNWGGSSANPDLIDDEPYIEWGRAWSLVKVRPPLQDRPAVTYPSASGLYWQTGQKEPVTWRGFSGSKVDVELFKGGSRVSYARGVANKQDGASYGFQCPSSVTPGSDYRVRVTSGTQADTSDHAFTVGSNRPAVTLLAINRGNFAAESRDVTFTYLVTGNPTYYKMSESASLPGSWRTLTPSIWFQLSQGNGSKTVYFKVKNAAGESPAVSDQIVLAAP